MPPPMRLRFEATMGRTSGVPPLRQSQGQDDGKNKQRQEQGQQQVLPLRGRMTNLKTSNGRNKDNGEKKKPPLRYGMTTKLRYGMTTKWIGGSSTATEHLL